MQCLLNWLVPAPILVLNQVPSPSTHLHVATETRIINVPQKSLGMLCGMALTTCAYPLGSFTLRKLLRGHAVFNPGMERQVINSSKQQPPAMAVFSFQSLMRILHPHSAPQFVAVDCTVFSGVCLTNIIEGYFQNRHSVECTLSPLPHSPWSSPPNGELHGGRIDWCGCFCNYVLKEAFDRHLFHARHPHFLARL